MEPGAQGLGFIYWWSRGDVPVYRGGGFGEIGRQYLPSSCPVLFHPALWSSRSS